MSKPTPLVCYYSALNPDNQEYSQSIPNINSTSCTVLGNEMIINLHKKLRAIRSISLISSIIPRDIIPIKSYYKDLYTESIGGDITFIPQEEKYMISNSFGFGGNCSTLIFSKEKVFALRPVIYNLKPALGGNQEIGLIAEEVAEVMPELVILGPERQWVGNTGVPQTDANGVEINDPSKMVPYSVYYDRLPVYLLSIIKEQEERINALEKRLNAMDKE